MGNRFSIWETIPLKTLPRPRSFLEVMPHMLPPEPSLAPASFLVATTSPVFGQSPGECHLSFPYCSTFGDARISVASPPLISRLPASLFHVVTCPPLLGMVGSPLRYPRTPARISYLREHLEFPSSSRIHYWSLLSPYPLPTPSKEKTKYRARTFPSLFCFLHFPLHSLQPSQTLSFSQGTLVGLPCPNCKRLLPSLRSGLVKPLWLGWCCSKDLGTHLPFVKKKANAEFWRNVQKNCWICTDERGNTF